MNDLTPSFSSMAKPLSNSSFNALQSAAHQLADCTDRLFQQIEQEQVLDGVIERIRSCLELSAVFEATSTSIRQLLNADRVAIFRLDPERDLTEGEFVAEDVGGEFPSALNVKVDGHCFSPQLGASFRQGRVQALADTREVELSEERWHILETLKVRATLVVPVLRGERLWGLLCIHQCLQPRRWQLAEIGFVQKIAVQLAIALQQAEQLEQLKTQAALLSQAEARDWALSRQKALVKIVSKIRCSLELPEICQVATDEVRKLLAADRVAVYRFNENWSGNFLFESVAEGWKPLVNSEVPIEDTHLMETRGGRYANHETFAIPDIYAAGHSDCHVELLETFQAKAYAIAPIFQDAKLWGLLSAFQNSGARSWQTDEVELLAQVGEQLGIAIQQAEFVLQIQSQAEALKASELQLIQHEKMASLGQLVAGVAHEINNPVSFIHGNLPHINEYVEDLLTLAKTYQSIDPTSSTEIEQLQAQCRDLDIDFILEDLPKVLGSIEIGTDRIRQIVLTLRNFSRLDEAEFKAVDIHEGLDSTLLILGNRLKFFSSASQIEIVKSYGEIPPVECFPAQLNQVFMNLLANAIDALEEVVSGREIEIDAANDAGSHADAATAAIEGGFAPRIEIETAVERDGQHVRIRIRDNGVGIANENAASLFDHFFTTKPIGKGTGLGLSISHEIVTQKHGGTLEFNTPADGGAEFVIRLPIRSQSNEIRS